MRRRIEAMDILTQGAEDDRRVSVTLQLVVSGIPRVDGRGSVHTNQRHVFTARRTFPLLACRGPAGRLFGPKLSPFVRLLNLFRRHRIRPMLEGLVDELDTKIGEHNLMFEGAYFPIPQLTEADKERLAVAAVHQARAMAVLL